MALVGDIQLQDSAVKPPALDTSKKFSAEGLTATTAFAVTDAGAGTTVSTTGLITAKSSNDVNAWLQTTKTDGNVSLYLSNDARPDWALKVAGTASDAFVIGNSTGANDTCQYPAFSIGTAGAVGIGKTGAGNILDITYRNSSTGGIVLTEATNSIASKFISEASSGSIGTTTNSKFGFRTNSATVGAFDTSGNFGIGTDAPGATLDVRGGAIFNEAGAAVDFRIEGDTEANLFFVDGSTDRIGIGTATPGALVDVDNGGATTQLLMCVNGCICAAGYLGEKQGHTIEDSGVAETQRTGLNFVVTDVGCVVDDSTNDATVVCINGANTCVPFIMCDGSTSDPISLVGGSIGNQLANDTNPTLGGLLCGGGNSVCAVNCITITGCYFGDGSQLTGVSSVPSSFSGDCTIIGCSAGGNVAGGGANIVLIGGNAGYNATTPSNIVVMGSSAALCMTTATDTVLIGTGSGRCVLTCAGNLALGAWSLYNECAGTYNTALGTCAGLTQKGATTNTFVGAYAGTAVTTGSGNVFVGYKAGCAATTGNCCLIIGNGTCDIITGDFNGGSLQIDGSLVNCGTLTVGVNDTGHDVKFFGASSGAFMLYDESADTLEVRGPSADATTSTGKLKLTTALTDINDNDVLGRIDFAAPLEAGGTDAILAGGAIWGEAEATFTSSVNSTALVFGTNTSAAATERMRIDSSGRLGVNNASPCTVDGNTDVVVVGDGNANADVIMYAPTDGNGVLGWTDTANTTNQGSIMYEHSSNAMTFATNGSASVYIDCAGQVTVGKTPTPASGYSLHLYKSSGNAYEYIQTAGTNGLATLLVGNDAQAYFYGVSADDKLQWGAGTDPSYACMTMDSSGNLGIGTTAPTDALVVAFTASSQTCGLVVYNTATDGNGPAIRFESDYSGSRKIHSAVNGNADGSGGALSFHTSADNSALTRHMIIKPDGNVGIGTSSPGGKLSIYDSTLADYTAMRIYQGGAATYYWDFTADVDAGDLIIGGNDASFDLILNPSYGNVGIGTTAPDGLLHVYTASAGITAAAAADELILEGSGAAGMSILSGNTSTGSIFFGDSGSNQPGRIQYNHAGDCMIFSTAAAEVMKIDSSGGVEISGSLSKGSGSFNIDHPLESKKDTHQLVHSFIEGPQADLMYRGIVQLVDGSAQINIDTVSDMTDGTFVVLNRCAQVFTTNESNWDAVRGSVTGNILTIESNTTDSTACISWMVVGERCDEHMMDTDWTDDDGKVIVEPIRHEEPEEPEE